MKIIDINFNFLLFIIISFFIKISAAFSFSVTTPSAPPSFQYQGEPVHFVDFKQADYFFTFDWSKKEVQVQTLIKFYLPQDGYFVFDLVANPLEIKVNQENTRSLFIQDPDRSTFLRLVPLWLKEGEHQLEVSHNLPSESFDFTAQGVKLGLFMADLVDRQMLEKFVPANLEFDQVPMNFHLQVQCLNPNKKISQASLKKCQELKKWQNYDVFTNGRIKASEQEDKLSISFPYYFNASSPYFHLVPQGTYQKVQFDYQEKLSHKNFPVLIYTQNKNDLNRFKTKTIEVLTELEKDFGSWPHSQLIIYGAGTGGMEYHGATRTSFSALGHELFHSYFARGVMPYNGNSGWLDEALASWRDYGYQKRSKLNFASTKLSGHSLYRRFTDRDAYSKGKDFLEFLHLKLSDEKSGGLKTFMRDFFQDYQFQLISTAIFIEELEKKFNINFNPLFDQYIYGRNNFHPYSSEQSAAEHSHENPYHPHYSKKELKDLL